MGGLNVANPVEMAETTFITSREVTNVLVQAIKDDVTLWIEAHAENLYDVKVKARKKKCERHTMKYENTMKCVSPARQRAIERARDWKTSSWLTVLPVSKNHFDLSAQESRHSLAI